MANEFDKFDKANTFDKFDEPQKTSVLDAPNAVATGYNKGLLRMLGLPVDTMMNVVDLGKAAIGAPYIAATGKAPPSWLQTGDRSKIVGSGENLVRGAASVAAPLVTAQNPDYEGGYLQAAGAGLGGIMSPNSWAQLLNQGVNGVSSALLGKGVFDLTGNTALSIAAGMAPNAIQSAAVEGTKYAIRGGEKGRREMEQRIADLKNAGIETPTLGLASGNKLVGGAENLLQSTPGAVGIMQRNRDAVLGGIEAKTMAAADAASMNRGAFESGRSIQAGAKTFKENAKTRQEQLYNRLDKFIDPQAPTNISTTKQRLAELNADIPGAPELSKQFKNARIQAIEQAIQSDTKGTPPAVMLTIKGGGGILNQPVVTQSTPIPGGSSPNLLPFEAVKKTRTLVGNEIADNSLMSTVPRSKWNPLYGALSEDIQGAAAAVGLDATRTYNRANDYTRSSLGRMERIAPIVDRPAPEQSFSALNATLKENASTLQAVKKSLPNDARGDFAGTVIERLGKAKPGQQNEAGDRWSPETFLTNWNNIKPKARDELLSGFPNAAKVKEDIDAVARATSMMRDNSKMWANPSGTGANAFARGTLGAIGLGGVGTLLGLTNPIVPLSALGAVGAANLAGRAVTSPRVVNSMASRSYIDPAMQAAQIRALSAGGLLGEQQ